VGGTWPPVVAEVIGTGDAFFNPGAGTPDGLSANRQSSVDRTQPARCARRADRRSAV